MVLTPNKIIDEYDNNRIDKHSAIKFLISLIENSELNSVRIESLMILERIGLFDNNTFKFLENLLLSDSNNRIRIIAGKLIKEEYLDKALTPMKWALQYENDIDCLNIIINTLAFIEDPDAKTILFKEVKKIRKEKYLDKNKRIDNIKFKKSLKRLLKEKDYNSLSHHELADIIINYKVVVALTNQFYSVYFELENAQVIKLDLADVEYEVRGWKSDFKNNIREISEITGLKYLKHLKFLNLSNNLISNVKGLEELENLTHLYISNNKISSVENLTYLKNIPNLTYLDICGNEFLSKIDIREFKNIEIKIKKAYY